MRDISVTGLWFLRKNKGALKEKRNHSAPYHLNSMVDQEHGPLDVVSRAQQLFVAGVVFEALQWIGLT